MAMDRVDQDYLNEIVNASTSDVGEVRHNVDIKDDGTTEDDIKVGHWYIHHGRDRIVVRFSYIQSMPITTKVMSPIPARHT